MILKVVLHIVLIRASEISMKAVDKIYLRETIASFGHKGFDLGGQLLKFVGKVVDIREGRQFAVVQGFDGKTNVLGTFGLVFSTSL